MSIESEIAEAAVGVPQQGPLRMFVAADPDTPQSLERAIELIHDDQTIHIPAAGAGSYEAVAGLLGLGRTELWDASSSAGDWSIRLRDKEGFFLDQASRYPHYGYRYALREDQREWRKGGRA